MDVQKPATLRVPIENPLTTDHQGALASRWERLADLAARLDPWRRRHALGRIVSVVRRHDPEAQVRYLLRAGDGSMDVRIFSDRAYFEDPIGQEVAVAVYREVARAAFPLHHLLRPREDLDDLGDIDDYACA